MDRKVIRKLLESVAAGTLHPETATSQLATLPFADFGIAKHDLHRPLRNGFSEVILCEGKQPEHILKIVRETLDRGLNLFATRASDTILNQIRETFPKVTTCNVSHTFQVQFFSPDPVPGTIAIVAAGTADAGVAEEVARTAHFFGAETARYQDVGVAGIHRLLSQIDEIRKADVVVVVAGMEGALPSVVGGLVATPVVAVPTSVGYGTSFGGVTALLSMLNACSEGISVVNIDNGFGAATAALRILRSKALPPASHATT